MVTNNTLYFASFYFSTCLESFNIHRHSSPKHYPSRSSGSTNNPSRVQDYRPNINDLKQFFDETKRHCHAKNPTTNFIDAKPSYLLQDEMLFDTAKRKEFERNKLKFDQKSRNLSSSSKHKIQEFRVPSKSFESRNDINHQKNRLSSEDYDLRHNMNINEQQYSYDGEASSSKKSTFQNEASNEKQDNTVNLTATNFNLDGFKVSEDDDDDDDVSCRDVLIINFACL